MKRHSRVMGGYHHHGGPNREILFGGIDDVSDGYESYTPKSDMAPGSPYVQRDVFTGPDRLGGAGIPFLTVAGGNFVSGPIDPAARLESRYALQYFQDAQASQPFAPMIQSNIVGPGPNTLTLVNSDADTKKTFCGILIEVNAPSLLNLANNTITMEIVATNDHGGVMNFNTLGAANGVFRFRMLRQSQGSLSVVLIPATVVQARAIATKIALANAYTGFGSGFTGPVSADLTIAVDGAPDGAQMDVTALTPQHPVMMNLMARAEAQVNALSAARS